MRGSQAVWSVREWPLKEGPFMLRLRREGGKDEEDYYSRQGVPGLEEAKGLV
jgi:hypothetical protein